MTEEELAAFRASPHPERANPEYWEEPEPRKQNPFTVHPGGAGSTLFRPARFPDPGSIPPRQWLYGDLLLRRYLTVLAAPGGVGKTSLTMGIGLSLACNRPLLGDRVHAGGCRVLFCSLEDSEDEFDRLTAAFARHHRLDVDELRGRVFVRFGREAPLVLAALSSGEMVYPDEEAMTHFVREEGIGAVMVDPWVNAHMLNENDNAQVNEAARAIIRVGQATGAGMLASHHTRKGAEAGNAEASRGAGALTNASRVTYTLTPMDEKSAETSGIAEDERPFYTRLARAKANLSPRDKARWFRLRSVNLGNGTPDYPEGDNVQAVESYQPAGVFSRLSDADVDEALAEIDRGGPGPGERYTDSAKGGATRWLGHYLVKRFGMNETQAKAIVTTWLKNGLLVVRDYTDFRQRKTVSGLYVDRSKRRPV
ncbi:AAA family ATPase [Belnapia moabensis]|uniref:AAA family ATPase n=1 Tax=Belnapia moabensis TaxID=365533 RepID=UPI00069361D4|nr:AAA family ATPase [Belnapia moabensis]